MKIILAYIIGSGIGVTILWYPILYLILKKNGKIKYEYRWANFLLGFSLASILSGFSIVFFSGLFREETESIMKGVLIPLVSSGIIIFVFNHLLGERSKVKKDI